MKEIIRLDDIRRDFRVGDETVHALRGVTFTICEGEFVTIMGTSGSGKSTLLNTLGCLDTPSAGEYYLDGTAVRSMDKNQRATLRNRKIGFVFQNYNLLPKTTAIENVELPLMYNPSCSSAERRDRAVAALKAVGLGDRLLHRSNQMSGGQMQRVAIARALVNDPAVILADEATGNLDTRTSFEVLVLFQQLHAAGTHHHLRHAQPRNRPIQQPQHHPARRPRHGRRAQRRYSRRGRDAGSAAQNRRIEHEFHESLQNSRQGARQQQTARISDDARHHHRRGVGHHDARHRAGIEAEHSGRDQRNGVQHDHDPSGRRHAGRRPARRRRHGVAQTQRYGGHPRKDPLRLLRLAGGQQRRTSGLRRQQHARRRSTA